MTDKPDVVGVDWDDDNDDDEKGGSPTSPQAADATQTSSSSLTELAQSDMPIAVTVSPSSSPPPPRSPSSSSSLQLSQQRRQPQLEPTSPTSPHISDNSLQSPSKHRSFFSRVLQRLSGSKLEPQSDSPLLMARPEGVPAKSPAEAHKHKIMLDSMMAASRHREEAKIKLRLRHEQAVAESVHEWRDEIFPNWATHRHKKRTIALWWRGVPPSCRGMLWTLALPSPHITAEVFEANRARARELLAQKPSGDRSDVVIDVEGSREQTVYLISLDISRTFPQLCMFQENGPYYGALLDILGAYTCYRSHTGYGMSFLAAGLLLNMHEAETFVTLCSLLAQPILDAFVSMDTDRMYVYFRAFDSLMAETQPVLHAHLQAERVTSDLYLTEWIMTLFSKSLPLDTAMRIWDLFFLHRDRIVFCVGLACLRLAQATLLAMPFELLLMSIKTIAVNYPADDLIAATAVVERHLTPDKFAETLRRHKTPV